jgi:hypothetical protein
VDNGEVTTDELRDLAHKTLEFGVECLRSGELLQTVHLVKNEGRDVIVIDPRISNDHESKRVLTQALKVRLQADPNIEAVLMLSDSYVTELTSEEALMRARLHMTPSEMSEMGFGRRREAIMVLLESPMYKQWLQQEYKRVKLQGDNGADTIVLIGKPVVRVEGEHGVMVGGLFNNLFEPVKQQTEKVH